MMTFVLVRVAEDSVAWGRWKKWRATCVLPTKTIDVFFYATSLGAARAHVRSRYPLAAFTDEVFA